MSKRLLLSTTIAVCLMAPLSAQAGSLDDLGAASGRVASWLGVDSVFGLHHFAHAHNAEVSTDSLGGLDAKSMAAKNKAAAGEDEK